MRMVASWMLRDRYERKTTKCLDLDQVHLMTSDAVIYQTIIRFLSIIGLM